MTKNRLLFLFIAAGLILAVVCGVYIYQINRTPTLDDAVDLLQTYTLRIRNDDLNGARALMTSDTASMLRDPGTALGEAVYHHLSLVSVENAFWEGNDIMTVDVILSSPDTLTIMAKAGLIFAEQVTESGPVDDADQAMAAIYEEILARDDLPMIEQFCVVRLSNENGTLRIIGNDTLRQAVEGGSEENLEAVNALLSGGRTNE